MELPLTQHPEAGPDRRLVPRAAVGTHLKEHSGRYRTWALASYLLAAGVKWTSSMRHHRDLGITQKTAWFLGHRIRECFRMDEPERFDGPGPVEVDEAYIGGKDRNKHAKKKHRDRELGIGKVIVAAARDRPSNRISAAVVGGTARFILTPFVKNRAGPDTLVVTDELASYAKLPYHLSVNHSAGQYVDGMAHTNGVESFWALLKRGYYGTYHKASPRHLQRYVDEFAGRHNLRPLDTELHDRDGAADGWEGATVPNAGPAAAASALASALRLPVHNLRPAQSPQNFLLPQL